MKPISVEDFSGGITEKDVPGVTNRMEVCDNLLIDADKRLIQRDGFDITSSTAYRLDSSLRVSRMANFKNDQELLCFQNKKAFAIAAGAWTEVAGPGGGSSTTRAFNTDNAAKMIDTDQWQGHLFAASSDADPVIKMYRDSGGTMRLRTAGMPEVPDTLYPVDGGLADAITLCNDLRTQMIAHFGSNGATAGTVETVSTKAHVTHADLTTQASAASASTAATTLGTLITLLNTLRGLHSDHIKDAQKNPPNSLFSGLTWPRNYHVKPASASDYYRLHAPPNNAAVQPDYCWFSFLNFALMDPTYTIPSSAAIADVLPFLNDLRDKWNWHNYAPLTHFNAWRYAGSESYTQLGVHATSYGRVQTYTWAKIDPAYGPLSQYLQDLKTEFDFHRTGGAHHQSDTVTAVPSGIDSTPDDLWECITLMGWLAHGIILHDGDSITPAFQLTCTSTAGSPTLATAEAAPATNALKDYWCTPIVSPSSPNWALDFTLMPRGTSFRCTANTAATSITCANNFGASYANYEFNFTGSQWHLGSKDAYTITSQGYIGGDGQKVSRDLQALDLTFRSAASLQLIADFAEDLSDRLKAHELGNLSVLSSSEETYFGKYSVYGGKNFNRYLPTARNATGNTLDDASYIVAGHPTHMHLAAEPPLGYSYIGASFYPSSVAATSGSGFNQDYFTERAPDAGSFNYKMLFRYDYTVGTKSFTDRGKPSTAQNVLGFQNYSSSDADSTEIGRTAVAASSIYAYSNAANENFYHTDTTNFKKEIYRTIASGQNYYRIDADGNGGSINNSTTTFSDVTVDEYLVDQLALYTNSGAPPNGRPPTGTTSVHVFNNLMFYVVGNRVYQSIPSDLDSVPSTFYEEFEEDILCVSSTKNTAVAISATKVYRLIGGFDDLGRGALTYERIFDRTGVISQSAVVKADDSVFFVGKDGIYATDGYRCVRATGDLEDSFVSYTNTSAKRARVQGAYDNVNKRIYWTFQTGNGSDPDKILVLDLQFGLKPNETPITTISKVSGFNPTALAFYAGQLNYGDGDGYTWVQTLDRNIDLVKDTGTAATLWDAESILWDFKSCHSHYDSPRIRKYFTSIGVQFEQQGTNVSCQITSDADKGRIESDLPVIRSRKLTDWGDSKLDWISSVYPAKAGNLVDEWRWFKGDGSLRSNFRAIELALAYCVIVKSDDMGTITIANVSGTTWSATLTSLSATRKWPLYSVGYKLKVAGVEYPVTVRTSDTVIRFSSAALTSPSTGVPSSWELWGHPKNERVRLLGYTVNVDAGGDNETSSKGPVTTGGQNA